MAMNRSSNRRGTLQGDCTADWKCSQGKAGEFAWELGAELRVGPDRVPAVIRAKESGFLAAN